MEECGPAHSGSFVRLQEHCRPITDDGRSAKCGGGDIGGHVINPTAYNMTQRPILDGFADALDRQFTIEGGRVV
jgi:hypothetical protein